MRSQRQPSHRSPQRTRHPEAGAATGAPPAHTGCSTAPNGGRSSTITAPALKARFYGSVEISPQKVSSSVQKIVDEIIQHLSSKYGAKLSISLEIDAENGEGLEVSTVRIVSENTNTLGFKSKGFE